VIHVLELDLTNPDDRLPLIEGPAWILLRAGDAIIGETWERAIEPTLIDFLHLALLQRHRVDLASRQLVQPESPAEPADPSSVSVVVRCGDHPQLLEGCVQSIRSMKPPPGDILIADNFVGASENDVVAAVADRHGLDIVGASPEGVSAQDLAWRRTRGSAVAFVDDADRVDHRFVAVLARAFAAPGIGAVTGLVLAAELGSYPQTWFEFAGGMRTSFRRHFVEGNTLADAFLLPRWSAASFAVRRDVLETVGGFDPALGRDGSTHGGDDVDVLHRVLDAGEVAVHEPGAIVRRVHPPTRAGLLAAIEAHACAHAAYQSKRAARSNAAARAVRRTRRRDARRLFVNGLRSLARGRRLDVQVAIAAAAGDRRGRRTGLVTPARTPMTSAEGIR
jgi:Glycosyltransferase like family 2